MNKIDLINKLKELAKTNKGKAPGREVFEKETGITYHHIINPKYGWRKWSDFVKEAGLDPNSLAQAISQDVLIDYLIQLTIKNKRFPTFVDLRFEAKESPGFPSHSVFQRLGDYRTRIRLVLEQAKSLGLNEVVSECEIRLKQNVENANSDTNSDEAMNECIVGSVYLFKSDEFYKIGKTNSLGRRQRQLEIQMPNPLFLIHEIKTDDINGIEAFWHKRFSSKRKNGEWFALDDNDIKVFTKRKSM